MSSQCGSWNGSVISDPALRTYLPKQLVRDCSSPVDYQPCGTALLENWEMTIKSTGQQAVAWTYVGGEWGFWGATGVRVLLCT